MSRAADIITDAAILYAGGTPVDFEIVAEEVLAELEALRAYAARYEFIRANGVYHLQFERGECGTGVYLGAAADQAIDAAIKEAKP